MKTLEERIKLGELRKKIRHGVYDVKLVNGDEIIRKITIVDGIITSDTYTSYYSLKNKNAWNYIQIWIEDYPNSVFINNRLIN